MEDVVGDIWVVVSEGKFFCGRVGCFELVLLVDVVVCYGVL